MSAGFLHRMLELLMNTGRDFEVPVETSSEFVSCLHVQGQGTSMTHQPLTRDIHDLSLVKAKSSSPKAVPSTQKISAAGSCMGPQPPESEVLVK